MEIRGVREFLPRLSDSELRIFDQIPNIVQSISSLDLWASDIKRARAKNSLTNPSVSIANQVLEYLDLLIKKVTSNNGSLLVDQLKSSLVDGIRLANDVILSLVSENDGPLKISLMTNNGKMIIRASDDNPRLPMIELEDSEGRKKALMQLSKPISKAMLDGTLEKVLFVT